MSPRLEPVSSGRRFESRHLGSSPLWLQFGGNANSGRLCCHTHSCECGDGRLEKGRADQHDRRRPAPPDPASHRRSARPVPGTARSDPASHRGRVAERWRWIVGRTRACERATPNRCGPLRFSSDARPVGVRLEASGRGCSVRRLRRIGLPATEHLVDEPLRRLLIHRGRRQGGVVGIIQRGSEGLAAVGRRVHQRRVTAPPLWVMRAPFGVFCTNTPGRNPCPGWRRVRRAISPSSKASRSSLLTSATHWNRPSPGLSTHQRSIDLSAGLTPPVHPPLLGAPRLTHPKHPKLPHTTWSKRPSGAGHLRSRRQGRGHGFVHPPRHGTSRFVNFG